MPFRRSDSRTRPLSELREEMIAEHSAFLSWALAQDRELPRIPRRRVDRGGFTELLKRPGARALVRQWWQRVLRQSDD